MIGLHSIWFCITMQLGKCVYGIVLHFYSVRPVGSWWSGALSCLPETFVIGQSNNWSIKSIHKMYLIFSNIFIFIFHNEFYLFARKQHFKDLPTLAHGKIVHILRGS